MAGLPLLNCEVGDARLRSSSSTLGMWLLSVASVDKGIHHLDAMHKLFLADGACTIPVKD